MSKGKKPDPKRRKDKQLSASYLKVGNGQKEGAYKAGEVYGCYGHRTHAHQPCLHDLTDGALKCPYCDAGLIPEWRGYLPLWDRDWALRYVLIAESIFESVDIIAHGHQVTVSRAKNPISPIVVREEANFTRKLPDKDPWVKPVEMLTICLTLWKNPALDAWFMRGVPDDVAQALAPPVKKVKDAPAGIYDAAHKAAEEIRDASTLDPQAAMREILRRRKSGVPSKNGDAKH